MDSTIWMYLAVSCVLVVLGNGHQRYMRYIPNGNNVPSPCDPSVTWTRVGHVTISKKSNKTKNAFGLDFKAAFNDKKVNRVPKLVWPQLCNIDSDGDGKTNGQELGDPDCHWQYGQESPSGMSISHPGFNDAEYVISYC